MLTPFPTDTPPPYPPTTDSPPTLTPAAHQPPSCTPPLPPSFPPPSLITTQPSPKSLQPPPTVAPPCPGSGRELLSGSVGGSRTRVESDGVDSSIELEPLSSDPPSAAPEDPHIYQFHRLELHTGPPAVTPSSLGPGPLGTSPDCCPPGTDTSCAPPPYPAAPTLRSHPLQALVQF
ncbi:unnamed protein product [Pleuronectes platessa]|uniref:Uncharacterized protein n=1 Tax=Pleuronectes platessa TaxID=8262 RepID=A0A9N7TL62_PLEPL|nr:unnamed protein product [Pleuronectes platessa]